MPFPPVARVIYERNPLREVVCELKFPTILKIGSSPPAEFQEEIRGELPIFKEGFRTMLPETQDLPDFLKDMIQKSATRYYRFHTPDEKYHVEVTSESLAIRTSSYVCWEDYWHFVQLATESLVKTESPAFFTRMGLRYIDEIDKAKLGVQDMPWKELIRSEFLGCIDNNEIKAEVRHQASITEFQLPENATATIRCGFETKQEHIPPVYLFDVDCFVAGQHAQETIKPTFTRFNQYARNAFRWAIMPPLHELLGPTIPPGDGHD